MKCRKAIKRMTSAALAGLLIIQASGTVMAADVSAGDNPDAQESTVEKKDLKLWYQQPADYDHQGWMTQALPIGNGYMGGMIYGGIEREVIQFNEKTLWSGGPGAEGYNYGLKENAYESLDEIRADIDKNGWTNNLSGSNGGMYGDSTAFGYYQNFGEVIIQFEEGSMANAEGYERYLDLRTATAGVSFENDGVTYTREYFADYPDHVMVFKFDASEAGALSFDVSMTSAHEGASFTAADNIITMRGALSDNGMIYESQIKVIPSGGSVTDNNDGTISVADADSVVMIMSAGTDYANDYPDYRGDDPHAAVTSYIEEAVTKGYDTLRENQLNDYQEIFSRVELDLDHEIADVPTDVLMEQYNQGTYDPKQIEVLAYQYGRYLMISSSREGSLPANLQGVWNDSNSPTWNSDYHFNINVQMNYWPSYVTNMSEVAEPLIDYIESLREPGRVSAAEFFNVVSDEETPENGWMVTTMNNPFGNTSVGWGSWGWAPASNAWICQDLYDYYAFTGDKEKLREEIYPIMKEAAQFWIQTLVEEEGTDRLVSSPSFSPEQGPYTAGNTFDQSLIWELYKDTIEASQILGVDEEFRNTLIEQQERLDPVEVGEHGQIKEWRLEDEEGFPTRWDTTHRHISHLIGLYPGTYITAETPEYFEAAKVSLETRGDDGTGWGLSHKLNAWARLKDGNHAYKLINRQLLLTDSTSTNYESGGTYSNLLCAHPPFQIDGNAGFTAGVSEMLLQSQAGYIEPLPALPDAWADGSYDGLVARGNFEIGVDWQNGSMTELRILSKSGNDCTVKYADISTAIVTKADGTPVEVETTDNDTISFATEAGESYIVSELPGMSVKIDNEEYTDFVLNTAEYDVTIERETHPEVPVVEVETKGNVEAVVEQAGSLPGEAKITLTYENGKVVEYTIRFHVLSELQVLIDGVPYEEFRTDQTDYRINLDPAEVTHVPKITYTTKGDVDVSVIQADGLPGTAQITAKIGETEEQIYKIDFTAHTYDYLSDLEYTPDSYGGYGRIGIDENWDGNPLSMVKNGETVPVEKGIFALPVSEISYDIAGKGYDFFEAQLAIDAGRTTMNGGVVYKVFIDDELQYESEVIRRNEEPVPLYIEIPEDAKMITLVTEQPGETNDNWSIWAYARLCREDTVNTIALIDSVSVGGVRMTDFAPDVKEYTVSVPDLAAGVPEVTAVPVVKGSEVKVEKTGENTVAITVVSPDGSAENEYTINFIQETVTVTLDQTELTLEKGDQAALTATVLPENASNKNVTWSSSDENVATVKDGVVTAVGAGEADITVTTELGGQTAVCHVTVNEPEVQKYTITVIQTEGGTITPDTVQIDEGGSQEFVIQASEGYEIKDALVDGQSMGACEKYTFSGISQDHTISAVFSKISGETPVDPEDPGTKPTPDPGKDDPSSDNPDKGGNDNNKAVQTGDTAPIAVIASVMVAAAVAGAIVLRKRSRIK